MLEPEIDLQREVLGAALFSSDCAQRLLEQGGGHWFSGPRREICEATLLSVGLGNQPKLSEITLELAAEYPAKRAPLLAEAAILYPLCEPCPPDSFARSCAILEKLARDRALETAREGAAGLPANEAAEVLRTALERYDAAYTRADLASVAVAGDAIRAALEAEEPESPLPGILDYEPHLHLLVGRPKSGKTTLALAIARAWAGGFAPWSGGVGRHGPGSRALVVSREQPVKRLANTLRRMHNTGAQHGDPWGGDRLGLICRGTNDPTARRMLELGNDGLEALRSVLAGADKAGDPIGLLVLDSLSRLKPPDVEENDNDGISRWLDSLESLCDRFGCWVLLIHHEGHTSRDTRGAARGASAMAAAAQVIMRLEREDNKWPGLRRLTVDGNIPGSTQWFRCVDEGEDPTLLERWEPVDAPANADEPAGTGRPEASAEDFDALTVWLETGEKSMTDVAWKVSGREKEDGKYPTGGAKRLAQKVVERWVREGWVSTQSGPRGAMLVRLRSGDLEL